MSAVWELVAPSNGGTVADLAVARERVLFAATSVGIYRSSDGGESWSLPGTAPTVPFSSAVAASPRFAKDRTLFACSADGLYRSTDAGDSWHRVLVGGRMFNVTVAADGATVLVATEEDGVLRSEDAGSSWTGANAGLLDLTVLCLALSPGFEGDHTAFAGTASGLYRTRNGGRSWRSVETGLPDPAVQCVAVSPEFTEDRLVLGGTEESGILRSEDGGSTWERVASGGVTSIAFRNGHRVAAATDSGIAISSDAGKTWHIAENSPRDPALCAVFLGDDLLVGLPVEGVMRGIPWRTSNNGLSARLDTALVLGSDGALFVSGLEEGVRVSFDRGATWTEHNAGLNDLAIHGLASTTTRVWAATPSGLYMSGAHSWKRCPGVEGPAQMVAASSHVVVAALGGGRLALSEDEGGTWRGTALPWAEADLVALNVAQDGALFAVPATLDEVTLWRSVDAGKSWERWWISRSGGVNRVALSATGRGSVWLGLSDRVYSPIRDTQETHGRERRPMWRSAPLGPDVAAITSLAVSGGNVFAATNAGVFSSRDHGVTFTEWSNGLAARRMVAIAVSPDGRRVYGLGLGGSVWRRVSS